MKLTLSWLKSHLETDAPLEAIVERLTMLGLEVDGVTDRAAKLAAFSVAYVRSAEPHPNADKLRVCTVDTGRGIVQVVCGAPNARAGMKGVFAPSGSVIPTTGLVLKPSVIRGVESNGMLCSAYEMGLSNDHDGIIELPDDAEIGASFARIVGLDDPVLDVKITPNRADCLGVRGIARDLAAAGIGRLKPLDLSAVPGRFASRPLVAIEDFTACPLYLGRTVRGVRNGPSPRWLQDRLTAIGLRPISALVDITNFVTFDLCRPLHVFDADKIRGDLVIRPARGGERLDALNGKEYTLEPGMMAITDDSGVIGLGGVIGGASTGCDADTITVYIESALFDPVRTAATGRTLDLQSDARYRFERGLDPAFAAPGMEIATRLVLEICGGEAGDVVTAGTVPDGRRHFTLHPERIAGLGGHAVSTEESTRILQALGCDVAPAGTDLAVTTPSWRGDIVGEADLVEEVLRIHGYDRIEAVPLDRPTTLPQPALSPAQRRVGHARRVLAARGMMEAVTYSFMTGTHAVLFGGGQPELTVVNPISTDLDVMRPSILPNLLWAAGRNADRGFGDLALFELGPVYAGDAPEDQVTVAAGLRLGRTHAKHWRDAGRAVDLFDVKADAMAVLSALGAPLDNVQVTADPPGWYHPGRAGTLRLGPKTVLGHFGELHPRVLAALDVKGPAAGFEIFLEAVPLPKQRPGKARPLLKLSPFQPVVRDYAFVLDAAVSAEALMRAARSVDRKLVTDVRLFDVYAGPGIEDGKKSLAIAVTLQPEAATLTEAEIEAFSAKLVAHIGKITGGVLRR